MEYSISDISLLIAVCALALWPFILFLIRVIQERNKRRMNIDRMTKDVLDEISTEELVVETLKKIGCQPQVEDDKVTFKYQGEDFYITAEEDNRFIMIWNPWWGSISADNEALPYLKEIVNLANVNSLVTVVYVADEEEPTVGLHGHCHTFFSPNEGDLSGHLQMLLDQFFDTQAAIKDSLNQLGTEAATQHEKERVKVKGFAAYKDNSTPINS